MVTKHLYDKGSQTWGGGPTQQNFTVNASVPQTVRDNRLVS
jgi:hypothetical protein